jgi:hypothetical protein
MLPRFVIVVNRSLMILNTKYHEANKNEDQTLSDAKE